MKMFDRNDPKPAELIEELLRLENLLLYTKMKLRYFPLDYGLRLSRLYDRRELLISMLAGSSDE